jgi:hypothetical protein
MICTSPKYLFISRWLFILIPFALAGLETITYPGFIYNYLGIHLYWAIPIWLVAAFIVGALSKIPPWPVLSNQYLTALLVIVTLLLGAATLAENSFYQNYVFATFGVNILGLVYLLFLLLGMGAMSLVLGFKSAIRYKKLFIVFAPIVVLAWAYYMQSIHYVLFRWFVREDGIVEVAQVFALFAAAYLSARLVLLNKSKDKLVAGIVGLSCFGFLLLTGEEISWGQRIFEWDTPSHYAAVNMQRETNLHNHKAVFAMTIRLYVLIGIVGSFAWISTPLLRLMLSEKLIKYVIPSPLVMTYFLPSLMYNYYRVAIGRRPFDKWEETTELLLYLAMAIHFAHVYFWQQRQKVGSK